MLRWEMIDMDSSGSGWSDVIIFSFRDLGDVYWHVNLIYGIYGWFNLPWLFSRAVRNSWSVKSLSRVKWMIRYTLTLFWIFGVSWMLTCPYRTGGWCDASWFLLQLSLVMIDMLSFPTVWGDWCDTPWFFSSLTTPCAVLQLSLQS